jgi:hypothetical protein
MRPDWSPRYSNDGMLLESWEWYLDNRAAVLTGIGGGSHCRPQCNKSD